MVEEFQETDTMKTDCETNTAKSHPQKQLNERQTKVVLNAPPRYQGILTKAYLFEASPRQAIKACCIECVGCEDVKERVGSCASVTCPLNKYRPYQTTSS